MKYILFADFFASAVLVSNRLKIERIKFFRTFSFRCPEKIKKILKSSVRSLTGSLRRSEVEGYNFIAEHSEWHYRAC